MDFVQEHDSPSTAAAMLLTGPLALVGARPLLELGATVWKPNANLVHTAGPEVETVLAGRAAAAGAAGPASGVAGLVELGAGV